jgi:hypothetical protein
MARRNLLLVQRPLRASDVGPLPNIIYQAAAGTPGLATLLFSLGRRSPGSGIRPPLIADVKSMAEGLVPNGVRFI